MRRRESIVQRLFKAAGHVAALAAILAMLGGHWLVLQSGAWARMIVVYSAGDSLAGAIARTFDGKHPCKMCLQIRAARQLEERQQRRTPLLKTEKMPDLILDNRQSLLTFVPAETREAVPTVPCLHLDFVESPPTPPPRGFFAVL